MDEEIYQKISKCDVFRLYRVLGKKWSMPILHTFYSDGRQTYTEIWEKFGKRVNPTSLSVILKELESLKIVLKADDRYVITRFGERIMKNIHEVRKLCSEEGLHIPEVCLDSACLCMQYGRSLTKGLQKI